MIVEKRASSFLLFLVLTTTGLAGCTDPPRDDCWEIPFPGTGFEVEYETTFQGSNGTLSGPMTVGKTHVFRGDGEVVEALQLEWGSSERIYYSLSTGDMVGFELYDHDTRHFSFNMIRWPALLFGQCLSTGDRLGLPYQGGTQDIQVSVLATEPRLEVERLFPPGLISPMNGYTGNATIERAIWSSESSPFPEEIIRHSATGGWDLPSSRQMVVRQGGPIETREASDVDPALSVHHPSEEGSCWERPLRHGDFHALGDVAGFASYLENMSVDKGLQVHLLDHPLACAALVTYEIVTEPSSTAYVWTTIFADNTTENYLKRWVVRCYEEPHLIVLYGECSEHNRYYGSDLSGKREGPSIDPRSVASDIGVTTALENAERLTGRPFTRFVWRANTEVETSLALRPILGAEPGPGFDLDYGVLTRDVRYVNYDQGVTPTGGHWEANYMYMWPSGWAYFAPTEILRTPTVG